MRLNAPKKMVWHHQYYCLFCGHSGGHRNYLLGNGCGLVLAVPGHFSKRLLAFDLFINPDT